MVLKKLFFFNKKDNNYLYFSNIFIICFLIFFDQTLKFFSRMFFFKNNYNNFFSLVYLKNTGIAFGFFKGFNIIFIIIYIVIFLFITIYRKELKRNIILLLYAGLLSNLLDRIFFGAVIDYIKIGFWPVFNLADFFIFLAVLLFFKEEFFLKNKIS